MHCAVSSINDISMSRQVIVGHVEASNPINTNCHQGKDGQLFGVPFHVALVSEEALRNSIQIAM